MLLVLSFVLKIVVYIVLAIIGLAWLNVLFFQGSACILFSSWAAISYQLQEAIHKTWMNMVHVSMIASNLATRGDPFVNFNLPSFNVKCSQNLFNLGHPCFSAVLIHKLLTYCFVLRVSAYILFYSCLSFFLDVFFGLPSAISCRNPNIEYGWTWSKEV